MAERLKKHEVEEKAAIISHLLGRKIVLYSAYGKYGVREIGEDHGNSHVMPGMGDLRAAYTFLCGMVAALDMQRGAL